LVLTNPNEEGTVMKKRAIFLCLFVCLLFSVDALAQSYYWDTTVEPWGWVIRKSTYENGTVKWELGFGLYNYGNGVTWDDIEGVTLWKYTEEGFKQVSFSRSNNHDNYYRFFIGSVDYFNSWLTPYLTCPDPSWECALDLHECTAEISGFDEPQLNEIYRLKIKLKGYETLAVSYPFIVPKTMNLKPIPLRYNSFVIESV
jgi:hypothetical protein